MTKHSDNARGGKCDEQEEKTMIERRGGEIESAGWSACNVADDAGTLPFPSLLPSLHRHLSDPHLHCRVMALGTTRLLQGEESCS